MEFAACQTNQRIRANGIRGLSNEPKNPGEWNSRLVKRTKESGRMEFAACQTNQRIGANGIRGYTNEVRLRGLN